MNGRWNVAFEQLNTMSVTSPAESLSILVVDDFVPFRETLREFFDDFVFIEVVGEAGDGNSGRPDGLRADASGHPYGCEDAWTKWYRGHQAHHRETCPQYISLASHLLMTQ